MTKTNVTGHLRSVQSVYDKLAGRGDCPNVYIIFGNVIKINDLNDCNLMNTLILSSSTVPLEILLFLTPCFK